MKSCCVIGLGYIGLPTAALIANNGLRVYGFDNNENVVNKINSGFVHIKEKNLPNLINEVVQGGFLTAHKSIMKSDVFIIAVPTPFASTKGKIPKPNLDYVKAAAISISKVIEKGNLVIIESTSPVGTTEEVASIIEQNANLNKSDFSIAYCPERVIPGNILEELVTNDRVIGGLNSLSSEKAKEFYSIFSSGKLLITDSKTAELVKLSENAFRDVNIAFANELSIISSNLGINVSELIKIANHHPRVNILKPGCGVGGHCIAVDPWFIASQDPDNSNLIQTSRLVNENKSSWVAQKINYHHLEFYKKNKYKPKVGLLGLTFKPNIEDIRGAPAINIFKKCQELNIEIYPCEPNLISLNQIKLYTLEQVLENCDLIFILVAHDEFKNLKKQNIIDFCGATN